MNQYLRHKSMKSCVVAGQTLLDAAKQLDTTAIAAVLAAFADAQTAMVSAESEYEAALAAVHAARMKEEGYGRELDRMVDALVGALVQDGRSRRAPLKAFGGGSADSIRRTRVVVKSVTLGDVAQRIAAEQGVSQTALDAAAKAAALAGQGPAIVAAKDAAEAAVKSARGKRRLAFAHWERVLGSVALAARSADRANGGKLWEDLFRKTPPALVKSATTPKEPAPAVTPEPTAVHG